MREDFKPIKGFERYLINSEGVVKSLIGKGRILKPNITKNGYLHIRLYKPNSCVMYTRKVHRLVYETFIGEIPEGMLVLHGQGNVRNNCNVEYLSLGNCKDNAKDKVRDGTDNKGVKHWKAKLTDEQVLYIKQRLSDGMSQKSIASLFQVARITISDIATGRNWKHILAS